MLKVGLPGAGCVARMHAVNIASNPRSASVSVAVLAAPAIDGTLLVSSAASHCDVIAAAIRRHTTGGAAAVRP